MKENNNLFEKFYSIIIIISSILGCIRLVDWFIIDFILPHKDFIFYALNPILNLIQLASQY